VTFISRVSWPCRRRENKGLRIFEISYYFSLLLSPVSKNAKINIDPKASYLIQRHLTTTKRRTSSAVQSLKWWLIGTGYSIPRRKLAAPIVRATDFGPAVMQASRHAPQSTTLGLHPVIHILNYMDHYSFTDPWGMDGWPIADVWHTKWSSV